MLSFELHFFTTSVLVGYAYCSNAFQLQEAEFSHFKLTLQNFKNPHPLHCILQNLPFCIVYDITETQMSRTDSELVQV